MSTEAQRAGGGNPRRPRRGSVVQETSHGGVAVRRTAGGVGWELLVIRPRGSHATALPKGGANAGETGAQTAAREIREETGIDVTVSVRLGEVQYWYRRHGRRVQKTVHWYLCEYAGGETRAQQEEVDRAWWMPLEQAFDGLSYPGEREMVERALSKLGPNG